MIDAPGIGQDIHPGLGETRHEIYPLLWYHLPTANYAASQTHLPHLLTSDKMAWQHFRAIMRFHSTSATIELLNH